MTPPREPDPPLARTPALEALLCATRARLLRQVWSYGLGTALGAASLWLVFAFLADWGLRVPHAIRVFHGLLLFALVGLFLWRDLLRPLRALPDRRGLAVLFERVQPELAELFSSAVQFQRRTPDGDPALVAATIAAADVRAREISSTSVIDVEAPRARFLLGTGGILSLLLVAGAYPLFARTFVERLFGGTTPWPQRTTLTLELPGLPEDAFLARTPELVRLRLARGTDVPVLVTAEGLAPEEVRLTFDGTSDLVLARTGGRSYRTLLQDCQEDLAFHVTGGDDEDGLPRVEVQVLQPPDVESLAFAVESPSYAGIAPALVFAQELEVLAGSRVRVHVQTNPRGISGHARLLPEDRLVPLAVAPFPLPADSAPGTQPEAGLTFECEAVRTLGFRLELSDANGLANPDPGLYRIRVVEDRVPELTVLSPARGEVETVPGGALPLRVRAEDDFGLADLGWRVRLGEGQGGGALVSEAPLTLQREGVRRGRDTRDAALGGTRLELATLLVNGAPPAVDTRLELEFFAHDQRAPQAGEGRSQVVRLRVVTPEELLRRLQDRLAQARLDALRLTEAQREKRARIEELLDAREGDGARQAGEELALTAALAGERRVLNDAQTLTRALAMATQDVLYARLDDKAGALLEFLDARLAEVGDERGSNAPWRALARECAAGRLSSPGFAGTLVNLVELSLVVSEDHAAASVAALGRAVDAEPGAALVEALTEAGAEALRVESALEALLAELAAWDNFQNVLTLARDILSRQKALVDRTQQIATENK